MIKDNSATKWRSAKNKTIIGEEGIHTKVPVNMDRKVCKTKVNNSMEKRTSTIENVWWRYVSQAEKEEKKAKARQQGYVLADDGKTQFPIKAYHVAKRCYKGRVYIDRENAIEEELEN